MFSIYRYFCHACLVGLLSATVLNAAENTQPNAVKTNAPVRMCGAEPCLDDWGLALSGGGTRAASFSMGVLGQLQATGVLDRFGAISTVSGGGMAAYYYYSQRNWLRKNIQNGIQNPRVIQTEDEVFFDLLWIPGLKEVAKSIDKACFETIEQRKEMNKKGKLVDISENQKSKYLIQECFTKPGQPSYHALNESNVFYQSDNFANDQKSTNSPSGKIVNRDDARHQLHVSSWRDLLADDNTPAEDLSSTNKDTDLRLTSLLFSRLGLTTALSTVPHFFANSLFDWRWSFAPSQLRYQSGIHRAYGISSVRRDSRYDCRPNDEEENNKQINKTNRQIDILCLYEGNQTVRDVCTQSTGSQSGKENAICREAELRKQVTFQSIFDRWEPLSFSDLSSLTRTGTAKTEQRLPLWIINTSVGKGGMALDLSVGKKDPFRQRNYEFTPFEVGNQAMGYIQQRMPDNSLNSEADPTESTKHFGLSVLDAVATSAAFFDPQQQTGSVEGKVLKGAAMHFLNSKWGRDVPNPKVGAFRRTLHYLLPFPLYYLNGYFPGMETPYLHLSDGGHASDNLGIYALLGRGYKKIVAVDGTFDSDGQLDDLCYLRWNLAMYHDAIMEFDGRDAGNASDDRNKLSLAKICGKLDAEGYDPKSPGLMRAGIHRWSNPIEKLKIQQCEANGVRNGACITRSIESNVPSIEYLESISNGGAIEVYYIKLAMDLSKWLHQSTNNNQSSAKVPQIKNSAFRECQPSILYSKDDGTDWATSGPPCNLTVFIDMNLPERIENIEKSGWSWKAEMDLNRRNTGRKCLRPVFPQHETEKSTLDGSRRSYYAYRDLGAFAARGISMALKTNAGSLTEGVSTTDRYLDTTCDHSLFPIAEN